MIEKQKLDEEQHQGVFKEWMEEAKTVESVDQFIEKLDAGYTHDYGSIVHACHAVMRAAFAKLNRTPQGGVTGFQASCLGWMLVRDLLVHSGEGPLRLVNYSEMLYPQNESSFAKTISQNIWEFLQKESERFLAEPTEDVHPKVISHWESIRSGVVPFGYSVISE